MATSLFPTLLLTRHQPYLPLGEVSLEDLRCILDRCEDLVGINVELKINISSVHALTKV